MRWSARGHSGGGGAVGPGGAEASSSAVHEHHAESSSPSGSAITGADDHFGFTPEARAAEAPGPLVGGTRCGGCTIVRLLAEGGMGRVYEARQDAPARPVALKVMRAGIASVDLARRFTREADLLALLRHPAVAQVHAAGVEASSNGDRPFIVMELVEAALTITAFARAHRLGLRDRVALFARVCDGMAHAHGQAIIHRDLKPANILVDVRGDPKVIDFGVGRSLVRDDERLTTATQQGELLGTVRYMSPEQLGVGEGVTDARSDVYSLGLVLHELLVGELPYELRGRTVMEAACMLARSNRLATRPLSARLAGGAGLTASDADRLAAIVATCLEPRAADRYAHAGELEADLGRWLAGEAVRARPLSLGESLARLARRHRAAAWATTAVATSLVVAATAAAVFWMRAERQRGFAERAGAVAEQRRREADARTTEARRQLYLSTMLLAAEARDRDNLTEARRLLAEAAALAADGACHPVEIDCLAASLDESLAVLLDNGDTVAAVAWSPDGRSVAAGTMAGRLRVWRPGAAEAWLDRQAHEAAIWDVAFSPDGRLLASASADGTVGIHGLAGDGGDRTLAGHEGAVYAADFSPDGGLLATASRDRTIRLFDTATWRERSTLGGHEGTVYSVRFSPAGERLVSASQDGTVRVWSVADAQETRAVSLGPTRVFRAAFSPDGRRVAAAAEDGTATVLDASTGGIAARLRHPTRVNAVAFLGPGDLVATASGDGLLRCWDPAAGIEMGRRRGHAAALWSLAVRPGETTAVTGSADGSVRCWQLDGTADPVLHLADRGQALAIAADGGRLAAGDASGRVVVVDPRTLRTLATFESGPGRVTTASFAPDGSMLAAAGEDGRVHRWLTADGSALPPLAVHGRRVYGIAFSPDGRTLATGSEDRTARVVDTVNGTERIPPLRHPTRVLGIAFHPDGLRLATACGDRIVRLWSLETGGELAAWPGHTGPVNAVCFSPRGERLASASSDGTVRIRDVAGGGVTTVLTGPARQIWQVAFSPDGGRVAATVADGTLELWDAASGRPVGALRGHRDQAWGLAFLPDGRGLATTSWDATVRLWGVSVASLARARDPGDPISGGGP